MLLSRLNKMATTPPFSVQTDLSLKPALKAVGAGMLGC